jgi:hypothetical protein
MIILPNIVGKLNRFAPLIFFQGRDGDENDR